MRSLFPDLSTSVQCDVLGESAAWAADSLSPEVPAALLSTTVDSGVDGRKYLQNR
jgi:hypothetical protein